VQLCVVGSGEFVLMLTLPLLAEQGAPKKRRFFITSRSDLKKYFYGAFGFWAPHAEKQPKTR
jgi:hypothetical protein